MRPLYYAKADRLRAKADELDQAGVTKLAALKQRNPEEYDLFRQAVAHLIMGLRRRGRPRYQGPYGELWRDL